mgnify:CR=1 FL=1
MTKAVIQYKQGTAQYYIEDLGSGIELEMVYIPDGTFIMGAPEDEEGSRDSERPQHEVTVPSFFMGKYPVTQAQLKAVAKLPQVERELKEDPSSFKGDNRPVEQVSWYDAVEFCARLSNHTGREYRLPSEAEWEYACRAGTTTPFHFGETITTDLANYDGTDDKDGKWLGSYGRGPKGIYREETTPVGSFEVANDFGLYDMHGNVWEWCLDDWHSDYEDARTDGRSYLDNENDNLYQKQGNAILRGGSWNNTPGSCRSASRYFNGWRVGINGSLGFRVACVSGEF